MLKIVVGLFLLMQVVSAENRVTYELSAGRFGDNLLNYMHAKFVSYSLGIPVLYVPFIHSEDLVLDSVESREASAFEEVFQHVQGGHFQHHIGKEHVLYVLPYFPECPHDRFHRYDWPYVSIDWNDEGFRAELRKMICPKKEVPSFHFPKDLDYVTVALHVRKGGGVDPADAFRYWSLKFPPDSYYIECLRKMRLLFKQQPLYVYLFTDDPNPSEIMQYYESQLAGLDITFDCRKENNRHDLNVIEDFFTMLKFDCLIRSTSNYTFPLPIIGHYKVVMKPAHFCWINGENYIDLIAIEQFQQQ